MNDATRLFALRHADDDVRQLALQRCKDPEVDLPRALQQIQGRQTARRKLPSWAAIDGIVYPPRLNMEQCSSEQTARYKASLCHRLITPPSSLLIDLTGGFGVDFAFMSQVFDEAVYVERDAQLCALATENFRLLCQKPVRTVCADASDFLTTFLPPPSSLIPHHSSLIPHHLSLIPHHLSLIPHHLSLITHHSSLLFFLDPARRDGHGRRTFALEDCTPNVIPLADELLRRAAFVLLKLSPMLDWRKAVADLGPHRVHEVHIVAVDNECKELLIVLSPSPSASSLPVVCVNDSQVVTFGTDNPLHGGQAQGLPLHQAVSELPKRGVTPQTFLFEPNAAIMKSGCFTELAARYGVAPLSPNSHLFTAPRPVAGFPGRQFLVTAVSSMSKRDQKELIAPLGRANISVRNFPLTASQLRQRLKLADGGPHYLFATTLADGQHVLLVCQKTDG